MHYSPMPSVRTLSIQELIRQSGLTQPAELPIAQAALHELLRRALQLGDEQAWDAAAVYLWPTVLKSIYVQKPDIAPAEAEIQAAQIILHFKLRFSLRSKHLSPFPPLSTLLEALRLLESL